MHQRKWLFAAVAMTGLFFSQGYASNTNQSGVYINSVEIFHVSKVTGSADHFALCRIITSAPVPNTCFVFWMDRDDAAMILELATTAARDGRLVNIRYDNNYKISYYEERDYGSFTNGSSHPELLAFALRR